ncbi:MAG TPA: DUF2281 domain-containing protein [Nodosilinea sp.]|nr:DUF2281 domain-containing protein [Nodosilinea sp.]
MTTATATLKAQILAELDQLSAEALAETLAYVKAQRGSTDETQDSPFLQAYQRSKQKRAEVYRRLADS